MLEIENVKKNEGQSIIEFMIFLPLILFLFTIIFNTGDAILASINQQKATRGFFYRLAKGNPFLPDSDTLRELGNLQFTGVGIASVGYQEKTREGSTSSQALAPCFKYNVLFGGSGNGETCEEPANETTFIRVYTAYGLCGESYSFNSELGYYQKTPDANNQFDTCKLTSQ